MFAEYDEGVRLEGCFEDYGYGLGVSKGQSFKSWVTGTQKALQEVNDVWRAAVKLVITLFIPSPIKSLDTPVRKSEDGRDLSIPKLKGAGCSSNTISAC